MKSIHFFLEKYILPKLYGRQLWRNPIVKRLFFIFNAIRGVIYPTPEQIVQIDHDTKLKINPLWDSLERHIAKYGFYERCITDIIDRHVGQGGLFIDVWANIWYHSVSIASRHRKDGVQVYAFEPVIRNLNYLRDNISLNWLQNVKVFDHCLWNSSGEIYVQYNVMNPGMSSIVNDDFAMKQRTVIKKLDDVLSLEEKKNASVMKIDVEWFEYEVLLGAEDLFRQNQSVKIIFEFSPVFYRSFQREFDIISYLKSFGFSLYVIGEDGSIDLLDGEYTMKNRITHQVNLFAIRE